MFDAPYCCKMNRVIQYIIDNHGEWLSRDGQGGSVYKPNE